MYKLIKVYTHGVAEVTGTPIFVTAAFNKSKNEDCLVGAFLYNERGVILEASLAGQ